MVAAIAMSAAAAGCRRIVRAPPIAWVHTMDEAEALATHHPRYVGRPVFAVFGATWDTASKELLEVTFPDAAVRGLIQDRFVAAWIDVSDDDDPAVKLASNRFKLHGTPTLIILSSDLKKELARANEFLPPAKLLALLEKSLG